MVMTHAINDPSGVMEAVMLVARDLGYLGEVQSTIRYSRKLAALGRLSAGVAHEVKNPLNAMMIHLELLRQHFGARLAASAGGATAGASPDAKALEHVDVIAKEIRRLDAVVQGFLKFNRPEDLALRAVNLETLVREVLTIVQPEAERAHVQLVVDTLDVPDVNGDPGLLRQAFLNLVLNACQAMPGGGTLRVAAESVRGHRVALSFADTGTGIEPEHLARIFDLYFTTREQGSGIGLSMVFRTVQLHDGEIEVQSTLGVGTTFRLLLPEA
jgi:signal transduction histidine kinase